jgi:arylmalonate decarboxylase
VEKHLDRIMPKYRWGTIAPGEGGLQRGPQYQFYRIVPLDVMCVSIGLGIRDYTPELVEEAMPNFWRCVDRLVNERVDHIIIGGAPISAQLGHARVRGLIDEVEEKTGLPGDAPIEAVIAGMHHLGLKKIAVASRWAPQLNNCIVGYLEDGGLECVGITERGHWYEVAHQMTLEEGIQATTDVSREAARIDPNVEAVFVPGGATMTLHAILQIEEEFGIPVFTNLNAEVWNGLIRPGIIDPVPDWGMLLASK